MSLGLALVAVLIVALRRGLARLSPAPGGCATAGRLHSLPVYHGAYAALWAAIPALLLLAAWAPVQSRMVDQAVLSSPEGRALPAFEMQRESILSEAREIANGEREQGFNPAVLDARAAHPRGREHAIALMGGAVALLVALVAAASRAAPERAASSAPAPASSAG